MELILDLGSGNSLPDAETAIKLIDEIKKRDTGKHLITLKTQLFESAPPNVPLDIDVFGEAWGYASSKGYHLTSSVFDGESLMYLLQFDTEEWRLPFIKIACRPDLYWLIGEIPRRIPVYVSHDEPPPECYVESKNDTTMQCVSKYPAGYDDYMPVFSDAISDHTVGWKIFNEIQPQILEKHCVLEHNDTNPDAGAFAVTLSELEEIL